MMLGRMEKMLSDAYVLERQLRKDPVMRKVYSGVRIYTLIAELEEGVARKNDYFETLSDREVEKVEGIFSGEF